MDPPFSPPAHESLLPPRSFARCRGINIQSPQQVLIYLSLILVFFVYYDTTTDYSYLQLINLSCPPPPRSYDRRRGINVQPPPQEVESLASPGLPTTGREGLFAPAEGTALDQGSVSRIVSRSLGNAVTIVRRRSSTQNGNDNENDGGDGGGLSRSSSRWRSWQELPPRALAKTTTTNAATKKGETSKEKAIDYPGTSSRVVAMNGHEARSGGIAGNNSSVVSGDTARHKAAGATCPEAFEDPIAAEKSADNNTTDAQPSAAFSSFPTTNHCRGRVPLVPRVATLTNKSKVRENCDTTRAPRRTKDFDPDNLECVRRHEASVAESARRVQRLRMETEKRSLFRARPLPTFLGAGNTTTGGCFGSTRGSGAARGGGCGGGASGEANPDLIAALEQVQEVGVERWCCRRQRPRFLVS